MCDAPPNEFHIPQFLERAKVSQLPNVSITVLDALELQKQDFGGLYNVGKAGFIPTSGTFTVQTTSSIDIVAMVGKGIIYDTGGLSLKSKVGMPGMKGDMAGAAAVLCAFEACVRLQILSRFQLFYAWRKFYWSSGITQ